MFNKFRGVTNSRIFVIRMKSSFTDGTKNANFILFHNA